MYQLELTNGEVRTFATFLELLVFVEMRMIAAGEIEDDEMELAA